MVSGRLYASREPGELCSLGGNGREKEVPAGPGVLRCSVRLPLRVGWAAVSIMLR